MANDNRIHHTFKAKVLSRTRHTRKIQSGRWKRTSNGYALILGQSSQIDPEMAKPSNLREFASAWSSVVMSSQA